ncbi:SsgA family sporulation/cell division regulator [Streptomyces griseus]
MSLHQDNAMPTAADDDEFTALMAASSLRAPHVRALSDPIPDEAQSRLRESAEGPDAEQEPTARTTQEATTTTDAGDASEDDPLDPCRPGNWQLRTFSWTMNSVLGTPEHHAPALHLRPLLAAGPPATTRTTAIHEWLLREPDNNRHYLLTHTEDPLTPTLLPCTTDPGPTYSSSSALLRMALFRQRLEHVLGARPGTGFPDYRLTRTSAGPSAESLARTSFDIELNTTCNMYTALRLAGEPESRGSFTSRTRIHALMKQAYESALIDYAAHELAGNSQRSDQQVRAPGTADPTRFGAPAPAHSIDRLAAGRLTDLLQPARPPHLEQLHQHPADGRTRCRIATIPDRVPAGAWRPLLLSALSGYPWAHGTTPGGHLITGGTALPGLTPQDTTAVTNLPLTPAHLLIATDSAVSLDQAHRHTIPEQAPTPPDLDAYTAQPGSLLLLPAATATAAGHGDSRKTVNRTHDTEDPDKELTSENSSSDPSELLTDDRRTTKLWTTRTDDAGDGLEQRMQLWMRQHHTEDDRGDRILTQLAYRTKDPYAVTAVFYAGTEEELEWTFARELLTDGLHTSVGIGDVIIWPGPQRPGDTQRIFIRLRPPGSTALLSLDRDDALEFLKTTQPLPQNPSATARTAVLATWEQELRDLICPSPGE